MFREMIRGRFLGHPIHVMLIHFPIGLFTAGVFFDVAATLFGPPHLLVVAFYCIAGGLVGGAAAMTFGMIDYIHLSDNEPLFKKAGRHALLQLSAWLLFGVVFVMKLPQYPDIAAPGAAILIMEAAAVGLMLGVITSEGTWSIEMASAEPPEKSIGPGESSGPRESFGPGESYQEQVISRSGKSNKRRKVTSKVGKPYQGQEESHQEQEESHQGRDQSADHLL